MKRLILPVVVVLILSIGLFFVSCDNLDTLLVFVANDAETGSLYNVVAYVDEYSSQDPGIAEYLADEDETGTLFAPVNAAFIAVFGDADGDGVVETEDIEAVRDALVLTDEELADALLTVIAYHVIPDEELDSDDVVAADGGSIGPTGIGENLNVTVAGSTVTLDPADGESGADIVETDFEASNGIAHTIDDILALSLIVGP
jgi:uncharacterized surface protein with fasciclin (FAS1) repeats